LLVGPSTVDPVHVSIGSPPVSVSEAEPTRVNLRVLGAVQACPAGHGSAVVEQSLVAEAVPAPMNAIIALTATAASASIFTYFIISPWFVYRCAGRLAP
jgi:hypothetical protein